MKPQPTPAARPQEPRDPHESRGPERPGGEPIEPVTTLAQRFASRGSPADGRAQLVEIFLAVCQTLARGHCEGRAHGNLCPEQVRLEPFGQVSIANWGPLNDQLNSTKKLNWPSLIRIRSDVVALGMILSELLGGGGGGSALAQGRSDPGGDRAEDVELARLALDCLSADPRKRPGDAGVVARRVRAYLDRAEDRARAHRIEAAKAHARAERERRARRWAVLAAATGAAATAVALTALAL